MATEFITDELSDTCFADHGDRIVLGKTASIVTEDDFGITSREYGAMSFDVVANGDISVASAALAITKFDQGAEADSTHVAIGSDAELTADRALLSIVNSMPGSRWLAKLILWEPVIIFIPSEEEFLCQGQ